MGVVSMQHERVIRDQDVVVEKSDGSVHRRVVFTKLVANKIAAVLKLMQEHLERAGLKDSLQVRDPPHSLEGIVPSPPLPITSTPSLFIQITLMGNYGGFLSFSPCNPLSWITCLGLFPRDWD